MRDNARLFLVMKLSSRNRKNNARNLPNEAVIAVCVIMARAVEAKRTVGMLPNSLGRYQGYIISAREIVSAYSYSW